MTVHTPAPRSHFCLAPARWGRAPRYCCGVFTFGSWLVAGMPAS